MIMLVNQAGIFFGPNSIVDVAGLIATTSDILDADFLEGTYKFIQNGDATSSIINKGQIKIRDEGIAALMAPGVENAGVISANLGKVLLASVAPGTSYTIDLYGDNLIHFSMRTKLLQAPNDQNSQAMDAAIKNTGEIHAAGGRVLLTAKAAKNVVHSVINTSGIIEANTVSIRHGEIFLDAGDEGVTRVSGQLHARGEHAGETGGTIKITGKHLITAENDATNIDVSGMNGGGEIYIGGEFKGQGNLPHAYTNYVGESATLLANAIDIGAGGTIVVWSDGYTGAHGNFQAEGGVLGGDGGMIETSGHELNVNNIEVSTLAINGQTGTWLLDPWNVEIVSAASAGGAWVGTNPEVWTPSASPSQVNKGEILTKLTSTDVTITTTGIGVDPGDAGNITLKSIINKTDFNSSNTLTLDAAGNININKGIIMQD